MAVPADDWRRVWLCALAVLGLAILLLEWRLWSQGFQVSMVDSEARWLAERKRASDLGSRALILLGASRMQLGMDLDLARTRTGLEPVQLAVDGSSFMPVLSGLASDPSVKGTIIIEVMEGAVRPHDRIDGALAYQRAFESRTATADLLTARWIEAQLDDVVRARLRSYSDGARPVRSLFDRALAQRPARQYLNTLPDRSRLADYSQVDMANFYYRAVTRSLDVVLGASALPDGDQLEQLEARARQVVAAPVDPFVAGMDRLTEMIRDIQSRGGRVILVAFPTSGLVREIGQRRFPREQFWNRLEDVGADHVIHYSDVPEMRGFQCPDGSHLDYRDRARFTEVLLAQIGLAR